MIWNWYKQYGIVILFCIIFQGGGGLVTQLKKSYSLTDLVMSPENEEASKVDGQMQRRALPQITDVTGLPNCHLGILLLSNILQT